MGDREDETAPIVAVPVELDAETMWWLRGLHADGEQRVRTVERLHDLLLRAARREAYRRRDLTPVGGVELDDSASRRPTMRWSP